VAGSITGGWTLTRQSWDVLKSDRSLVTFPMLSAVFAVLAVVEGVPAGLDRRLLQTAFDGHRRRL
jgi:hypothetical protein